jgi:small nuclear ribonucleoprotein (snRNP)-like protein
MHRANECTVVSGTLKGYDQLMNLVLDEVKESMRGRSFHYHLSIAVF